MKKLLSAILILATTHSLEVNVKPVKSSVKNVTVFTQSAQVFRNATVFFKSGCHRPCLYRNFSTDHSVQFAGRK